MKYLNTYKLFESNNDLIQLNYLPEDFTLIN